MKRLLQIILSLMLVVPAMATEKPDWCNGYHKDLQYSTIRVVNGYGNDIKEARQAAVQQIVGDQAFATGQRVQIEILPNGNIVSTGKDALTVKARILDGGEYIEHMSNGGYKVKLLVQVAKNPTYDFERVDVTRDYGFSPAVFIPGMAQIKKGSTVKGAIFITTEIAAVGTIIVAECLRSSNMNKTKTTSNLDIQKKYLNNADTYQNIRNVAIGAAAAIYLWNVIDGIVAKGKTHVVVKNGVQYALAPFADTDGAGVSLCLNF